MNKNTFFKKTLVFCLVISFMSTCFASNTVGISSLQIKNSKDYEGTLSGYVTDLNMNPIESALVRVYFHGTYRENYSDSTGYYHVTDIPICYCMKNATCSKEGYYPEWVLLSIYENTTYNFVLTPMESCYPVISGTMGQNGWYISPVTITFVGGDGEGITLFVKIDSGDWFVYTGPFVVDADGVHTVWWYYIDQYGNESPISSVTFKMDTTPPTVTIIVKRIGLFEIGVSAYPSDNTSGVVLLEFYLDDALVGNITVPPYEFIFVTGLGEHTVKVIAYDSAGLNGSDSVSMPYVQSQSQSSPSIQQNSQNLQINQLIQNLILHHQMINR